MGEVDAFQVPGLKCYFPSGDHYPHHFEVLRRGEYVVRVYFLRTSKKRGLNWDYKRHMDGTLRPEDAEVLYELVMKNKRRLLREWNEKVSPDRKR
jgi:hypothetical protein